MLGTPVIYTVHDGHHTTTEEHVHLEENGKKTPQFKEVPVLDEKGNQIVDEMRNGDKVPRTKLAPVMREIAWGSVHHPELREFAGQVGRVNDDGTVDIVIFPPNKEPKWVERVGYSATPTSHSWRVADEPAPSAAGKKAA